MLCLPVLVASVLNRVVSTRVRIIGEHAFVVKGFGKSCGKVREKRGERRDDALEYSADEG